MLFQDISFVKRLNKQAVDPICFKIPRTPILFASYEWKTLLLTSDGLVKVLLIENVWVKSSELDSWCQEEKIQKLWHFWEGLR